MKKQLISLLSVIFALSAIGVANAQVEFNYEVITKSDNPIVAPGDQKIVWTTIKNTGNATWYADWTDQQFCGNGWCDAPDPIRLGTIRPHDRSSDFFTSGNWISSNRAHAADQDRINPGQTVDFGFYVSVPDYYTPGTYTECFAPVIENVTWMSDQNLCWDITVDDRARDYDASIEYVIGESYKKLLLEAGEEATISYTVKNTGSTTWYQDGSTPIHLAITGDYNGQLYHSSWLSMNRPAKLLESTVAPGEYGTFEYTIQVPNNALPGDLLVDEMWIVAENHSWFPDNILDPYITCEVEVVASSQDQEHVYNAITQMIAQDSMSVDIDYRTTSDQSNIALNAYMEIDAHDPDQSISNSSFTLELDEYSTNEQYVFGLESRQKGDIVSYFKLDIGDLEKMGFPDLAELDQQWIKIDQEDVKEQLGDSWTDFDDLYQISEEIDEADEIRAEKIAKAIKYSGALIVMQNHGSENINGHPTTHYTVSFNETQFDKAINLTTLYNSKFYDATNCGASGEANINCISYEIIHEGDIWVGSNDDLLYKILVTDSDDLEITLDDYGQRFDFVEPTDYITLDDLQEILEEIFNSSSLIQSAVQKISSL